MVDTASQLLNVDELKSVYEESRSPKYKKFNILNYMKSGKLSILDVHQTTGLTMIYGNEHTGYTHIFERHSPTSRKPYWDSLNRLGKPTKFSLNIRPIEYISLASQIFKPENLNVDKNKRPDTFDLYIGKCKFKSNVPLTYKLLTYKNSKVIHTLFLDHNKQPFNKKKILNLRQGWCSSEYNLMTCVKTIYYNYYDHFDRPLFKVLFCIYEGGEIGKYYLQINNKENGSPVLTTYIGQSKAVFKTPTPRLLTKIDFSDISWIEKKIQQIMIGDYKYLTWE